MKAACIRTLALVSALAAAAAGSWAKDPPKPLSDIQVPSGITLADWVTLHGKPGQQPSLATAQEAAQLVRQHGAYRELLDVIWRFSQSVSSAEVSAQNAGEKIPELTRMHATLGDWPPILLARARAHALLNNTGEAKEDLKRYLLAAPAAHPERAAVVGLLVRVDSEPGTLAAWAQEPPRR